MMSSETYVLKNQRGGAILSFDRLERARERQAEQRRRGVNLSLWRVRQVEEPLDGDAA